MPAVSKKQQRFFGYLLSNPEERKKKGISKKAAKDFAQDVKEVAPPGWGHTKAEKEKTKPWKPKSKIGGTAAAFKRALDDGRFKGLPGSKTKKEKTADMFKLMWAMKKKGDKPHYKPGTDKKYKKYQEEDWKPEIEVVDTKKRKKEAEKKRKEAASSLPPHLRLDAMKKAFAHTNEEVEIEEKYGSWKKDVKDRDKAHKKKFKKGGRRKTWARGGTEKLSDVNKAAERKSMQSVGGFRGVHGASKKSKAAQGRPANVVYNRKSPAATSKPAPPKGTFYALQKRIKESASIRKIRGKRNASLVATGDHRRDKEGNIEADFYKKKAAPTGDKWKKTGYKKPKRDLVAMRARKKAKREKREARAREIAALPLSKSARATTVKEDFKRFMADAQAARERVKKKQEERKKKDAQFTDTKKHGIKFYDKKGSGRIVKGKKVYN